MESAVACIGIWSCLALLNLLKNSTTRNGVSLGALLGIGFFIKSSTLLFLFSSATIVLVYLFKKKQSALFKAYVISLGTFFLVDLLLFINPIFWQTFASNNRYAYSFSELFTFPVSSWLMHLWGFFEIGFVFFTPIVFLFALVGIFFMWREKETTHKIFLVYFIVSLLLEIFSVKSQNQRYLVSFLPFLVIPAVFVCSHLWQNIWKKSFVMLAFVIPFVLSLFLIFRPDDYIFQLSKLSSYSDSGYIRGQASGYGITDAMEYITDRTTPTQPTLVLFGLTIGNPESAVDVYSQKNPQLYALHMDSQFFPGIEQYQCLTSDYPVFFVTRMDQLAGMERYFSLEKSFINPDKHYSVRVYTLKKECTGKSLSLSALYQPAINQLHFVKTGY
jgi:hypothetical protein